MVRVFETPELLLPALADFIVEEANKAIAGEGRFNFVLSGGSSPKKLYELLASGAYRSKINWSKVFFFFGDERYVPADDPDSNFRMAQLALFDPLGISEDHIFAIDTTLPADESARAYEEDVRVHFKNRPCTFDLILLGLGDNAHTASLFPHTRVLHETKALVAAEFIEEVKMFRITFTAPLINLGRAVVFLVYGAGKAEAVRQILEEPRDIERYPAQLIGKKNSIWFLDKAAAAKLRHPA
jgi:6-phosphogluconolactonase